MRLQKYIDIGASLAEDCSVHRTVGYTYTDIDTYANTPYGRLAYLDGANYIESTTLQHFIQQTGVFTISFRAKRDATSNTDRALFALGVDGSAQTQGWMVYFNNADYIYINIYADNAIVIAAGLPISVETTTDWNTYTLVGDGSAVNLYINGISRGQVGTITTGNLGGEQVQYTQVGSSTTGMTGYVADAVVCDWAWSTDEITAFAEGQFFDYEKDVYARWPMDDADNIVDESFKSVNGATGYDFNNSTTGSPTTGINDRLSKNCIVFDGTDYISLKQAAATSLSGKSSVTITAWVKNGGGGPILGLWNSIEPRLHVILNGNGTITTKISTVEGAGATTVTSNIKVPDNDWHHIAVVIDLTNDSVKFYVDGNLDSASYSATGDATFDNAGIISYVASDGFGEIFTGSLSEVRIYEKALTFSQVKESANKVLENVPSYNVEYWSITNIGSWTLQQDDGGLLYSTLGGNPYAIMLVEDTGQFFAAASNGVIYEFSITGTDLSTLSFVQSADLSPGGANSVYALQFNDDGTKIFTEEYIYRNDKLHEWALSTPYDISTATLTTTLTNTDLGTTPFGVYGCRDFVISPDGTSIFITYPNFKADVQHAWRVTLSTPWDLSSFSVSQSGVVINDNDVISRMKVNPAGTQIFIYYGAGSGSIRAFNNTGWNQLDAHNPANDYFTSGLTGTWWGQEFSKDGSEWFGYNVTAQRLRKYSTDATI